MQSCRQLGGEGWKWGAHAFLHFLSSGLGLDCQVPISYKWASLVAQMVKNLSTMRETLVLSLGWEVIKHLDLKQFIFCSRIRNLFSVKVLIVTKLLFFPLIFYLSIYLAVSGLTCSTWDLLLWSMDSLCWEDPLEKGKATHSSVLGLLLWLSW